MKINDDALWDAYKKGLADGEKKTAAIVVAAGGCRRCAGCFWRWLSAAALAAALLAAGAAVARGATISHGADIAVVDHGGYLQINTIPHNSEPGGRITFTFPAPAAWFQFSWEDTETFRDAFVVEAGDASFSVPNAHGFGVFEWSGKPLRWFTIWDQHGDGFHFSGLEWRDAPEPPREVPEPGAALLMAAGAVTLFWFRFFDKGKVQ